MCGDVQTMRDLSLRDLSKVRRQFWSHDSYVKVELDFSGKKSPLSLRY